MWEWVPIAIFVIAVGGFYIWSMYLALMHGIELGKRMVIAPESRVSRAPIAEKSLTERREITQCPECGYEAGHAPDCRAPKPKPGRPFKGFSRIKQILENQETENAAQ